MMMKEIGKWEREDDEIVVNLPIHASHKTFIKHPVDWNVSPLASHVLVLPLFYSSFNFVLITHELDRCHVSIVVASV